MKEGSVLKSGNFREFEGENGMILCWADFGGEGVEGLWRTGGAFIRGDWGELFDVVDESREEGRGVLLEELDDVDVAVQRLEK